MCETMNQASDISDNVDAGSDAPMPRASETYKHSAMYRNLLRGFADVLEETERLAEFDANRAHVHGQMAGYQTNLSADRETRDRDRDMAILLNLQVAHYRDALAEARQGAAALAYHLDQALTAFSLVDTSRAFELVQEGKRAAATIETGAAQAESRAQEMDAYPLDDLRAALPQLSEYLKNDVAAETVALAPSVTTPEEF